MVLSLILNKAWTFITKKGGWKILVAIGIFLLIMWNVNLRRSNNEKDDVIETQKTEYSQNMRALTEEMSLVTNKLGEVEANSEVYMASQEDLIALNSDLSDEIKKVKGDVISVIKSSVASAIDSLKIQNEINLYNDSTFGLAFNSSMEDNGFKYTIKGESKFGASIIDNKINIVPGLTEIHQNTFEMGITYGFKEEDDHYKVFATSPSSYVIINELEGALILDKKKEIKRVKPLIVFGPSVGWSYLPMENVHGLSFGVTATVNLFGMIYK